MHKGWAAQQYKLSQKLKETSAASVNSIPEPELVQCLGTVVTQADSQVQTLSCEVSHYFPGLPTMQEFARVALQNI